MPLSIILPVFNESEVLEHNVKRLEQALVNQGMDYELIISEDGSTDGTLDIARRLEGGRVRLITQPSRCGKGAAIKNAAALANADIIIFMDADLASEPAHIPELVGHLAKGADIVVGSRYIEGSDSERDMLRHIASRSFNLLVRILLGSRLRDHQCGFKAFRKVTVLPVIDKVENSGWFWDTEFLVRAQRKGLGIIEIPIRWREEKDSKFNLFTDSLRMAWSLARFAIRR